VKKRIVSLLLLLIAPVFLRAQAADNTSLVGTVTDPTGSVVVGAKVVGTNRDTRVEYAGTTNTEGFYSIPFVSPGTYDITVEMKGFKKVTSTGVVVTINHAVRTDFTISVGSEASEITVSADTPTLSTDDALLGETVDTEKVHDLPLNGRHAIDLAATASNITLTGNALTGNPPGNRASGSGTRPINNSISLDGISIMNNLITTATLSPNPDALDSVQTQNGNYTAQYGDYLGVHINLVSKSGTNKFHGTAYNYLQNDAMNAKGWLQPQTGLASTKPLLRYNLFGGVLGGPVIIPGLYNGRDKTFFLGSYEGLRNKGATPTQATVLTNLMRQGNFSEITTPLYNPKTRFTLCSAPDYACPAAQYPGNIIPVDPISAKVLPYLSAPTSGGTVNNWQGNLPTQINADSTMERVDHNVGQNVRLFGRFAWQSVNNFNQAVNLANTAYTTTRTRNGVIGYTHIITPRLVNDLRFGFNVVYTQILNQQAQKNDTSAGSNLGIPGFTADVDSGNPGLVDMSLSNGVYQGIAQTGTNWYQDDRQLTWYDQISYTIGKHALMAGVSFRKMTIGRSAANTARGQFVFDSTLNKNKAGTTGVGDAAAAFIAGTPTSYTSPFFQVKGSIGQWRDGFFVQDTWQVRQDLTLQLGLRYELPQVAYSLNGVGRIMDPTLTTLYPAIGGTTPQNAQKYPGFNFSGPNHDNISPRVGFSYRATDKIVIRGGGGIYYNANQLNSYTLSSTNYPYSAVVTPSAGFGTTPPFTLDNPNVPAPAAWPGPSGSYANFTVDHNLPTARMYQWNLDVGHEIWKNAGLEFQYLGSRTIHLDQSFYPNQPDPSPIAFSQSRRPNPAIGQIREIHNDGFGTYNGLTVILRQRMTRGLSANLSYTWSHALDTSDSSNDGGSAMWQGHLKLDYGNSIYDIRNRFVAAVTYELPKLEGSNMVVRQALGGWQANTIVDLRTGAPINVIISTNQANVGGVGGSQRPNYVHQSNVTCSRGTVTGSGGSTKNSCIDATAYSTPPAGTFGNLHRNAIFAPGVANTNFSLFKNFPIWESVSFQLRGEAFNVFNHPNPGTPNTTLGGSSFGTINSANTNFGSRVLQVAGKINF